MRPSAKENDMASVRKAGRLSICLVSALALALTCAVAVYAQPLTIPQGTHCAECGMAVDRDSKFSASVIDEKGGKLFFCDIGDMLYHFKKSKAAVQSVNVRDYASGAWIDGKKAWYVLNKKFVTPMYWSVAAFSTEADAKKWGAAAGFDSAFGLIK
ncbi:MAG: nitrous oxide reductase accessory protein NosL [Nitrospirae bacterium]|nr:nitrous oxide reductase accessory protein NosL [Nitrospirota bacterium]